MQSSNKNQQKTKKNHTKTLENKKKLVLIFVDMKRPVEYNGTIYETWRTSVMRKEKRGDV